jgi:integrase
MAAGDRRTIAPNLRARMTASGEVYEFRQVTRLPDGSVKQRTTTLKGVTCDEDALKWWGALSVEAEAGKIVVPKGDLRLDDLAEEMFERMDKRVERGQLAEGTLRNYRGDWTNHVQPYFGNCRVKDIGHRELIAWLDFMRDKPGRGGETMAGFTINNAWNVLRNLLRFAFEQEYIALNPCDRVPRDDRPRQQPRRSYVERANETILRDDELVCLLDYMRSHEEHFVGLTTCLAYTGMRLREACGLRPGDVDGKRILLAEQLLPLRRGEQPRYGRRKEERLGVFKRSHRVIPILPRLRDELVFQSSREPEGSLFLFSALEAPGVRPIDGATVCRSIARSGERSGVGRITPKDLRRTAACVFAAAGIERQVASGILGHTPEVYDANYARPWADEREQDEVERLLAVHRFGVVEES